MFDCKYWEDIGPYRLIQKEIKKIAKETGLYNTACTDETGQHLYVKLSPTYYVRLEDDEFILQNKNHHHHKDYREYQKFSYADPESMAKFRHRIVYGLSRIFRGSSSSSSSSSSNAGSSGPEA